MGESSDEPVRYACAQEIVTGAMNVRLPSTNVVPSGPDGKGIPEMALTSSLLWKNGSTLKISFMKGFEGEPLWRQKVKDYARQWDALCNLHLDFGDHPNPDIRIAFKWQGPSDKKPNTGSWSFVGTMATDPKIVPKDQPTMNFGWLDGKTKEEEWRRVVLHEFGHALGCVHEHQGPASQMQWDEDEVKKYFKDQNPAWDDKTIYTNVTKRDGAETTTATDFDLKSIMLYGHPAKLTKNKMETPWNTQLSDMDKQFIRQMYPPPARTMSYKDTSGPPSLVGQALSFQINFEPPYRYPPKLAIGISGLGFSPGYNFRFQAKFDRITSTNAVLSIGTWYDTPYLYDASASWFEGVEDDPGYQVGEFKTSDVRPSTMGQEKTEKRIVFPRQYTDIPRVLVMLKAFDMDKKANVRIHAYASDVKNDSFVIHIDSWHDSVLYWASADWIAFGSKTPHLYGGSMIKNTENFGHQTGLHLEGQITYPAGTFVKPAKLRLFVNKLDFDHSRQIVFSTSADRLTADSGWWNVKCHDATVCYGIGLTYIAF